MTKSDALSLFSPVARAWFRSTFAAATLAQERGWEAISSGENTLLLAPTGSGKTLAAFLWCLDRLANRPPSPVTAAPKRPRRSRQEGDERVRAGVSVLYISPIKALSYDVERNLRAPLAGLRIAAAREGLPPPDISVATRTGDTPQRERQDIRRDPPDVLITTPESLYLLLTSESREILRTVDTVIIDEIHTMAGTKRGAHLSLSLERLECLVEKPPQRIGLSATQRPLDEIAKYLAGDRPVRIIDAGSKRNLDLQVVVPVPDLSRPAAHYEGYASEGLDPEARSSVWPAIYPELLKLVKEHRSTLIFVNNRRLAERLAARLNDLAGEELVRAHHGSVSREQRMEIEEKLKEGSIPGLVCTSSLELGIDMGAVDLVIQVESPKSVARGLQRIGRAGHQVGGTSAGRIFPKFRGDLLECAVLTERMRRGAIEKTDIPRNPLDVLSQQIVAMTVMDTWPVDDLERTVHKSYNFASLSRDQLEGVLGMLAGQYPSDEFADLKPRIIWDRETNLVSGRRDAKTIAVVNAGTIPDRGLYGVFLGAGGPRVGELDEEMVYECRPGEVFVLGASSWRIEQITRDQVIVTPAPGQPGKMPFWKGDGVGRPLEFGRAIGAFTRTIMATPEAAARKILMDGHDLDELAATNLLAYLREQKEATGAVPDDRTIVVERFRDELGDWRIAILTPFGARVHTPWALALEHRLQERSGFEVQTLWSDDGIALRFAGGEDIPDEALLFPEPEEIEELVVNQLANSALFASRFRENAGRALLLPRQRPGMRSPLWLQRLKAQNLLAVASRYGSFPIILETYRECLQDVFDVPGLVEVLTAVRSRAIRRVSAETREASPFSRSLVFDYVAAYMYESDAPLAERRTQALTLDRSMLRDLLGETELRELLDPVAVDEVELELQHLVDSRKARTADQLHDLLRRVGDLSVPEIEARVTVPADVEDWLLQLVESRRACFLRIASDDRWIPIEDAGRYRDALGVPPPLGVPEAFLKPTEGALEGLLGRFARTHAPFLSNAPATRWNLPEGLVHDALSRLEAGGSLLRGDFRPGGSQREWCDPEVLRSLRRKSLAKLRHEVEPVLPAAFARFLLRWQGVGSALSGIQRLRDVTAQLEGLPIAASILEREILSARVHDYNPKWLDELGASGELAWFGAGQLGPNDGRVVLVRREQLPLFGPAQPPLPGEEDVDARVRQHLLARGASFFADLAGASGAGVAETLAATWRLTWAGQVTNDTLSPMRALGWTKRDVVRSPRGRGSVFPPEAGGRWSAIYPSEVPATQRAHALATSLLDRYGVVTRETVAAEGINGGFAAVYPVLKAMEESGRVRRGYFIEGLGGAQFALPGAVDALRLERDAPPQPEVHILAATDPASPWGASLAWPRREDSDRRIFARASGASVVLVDGEPVLYVERGGKGVSTLPAFDDRDTAIAALQALMARDPAKVGRPVAIERIDGLPASESPALPLFGEAGFVMGYRGLTPARNRVAAHARG